MGATLVRQLRKMTIAACAPANLREIKPDLPGRRMLRSASAIQNHSDADLVMVYVEEPDGSEHQFLLTDPRRGSAPIGRCERRQPCVDHAVDRLEHQPRPVPTEPPQKVRDGEAAAEMQRLLVLTGPATAEVTRGLRPRNAMPLALRHQIERRGKALGKRQCLGVMNRGERRRDAC